MTPEEIVNDLLNQFYDKKYLMIRSDKEHEERKKHISKSDLAAMVYNLQASERYNLSYPNYKAVFLILLDMWREK